MHFLRACPHALFVAKKHNFGFTEKAEQGAHKPLLLRYYSGMAMALLVVVLSSFLITLGTYLIVRVVYISHCKGCCNASPSNCWIINPSLWNQAVAFYGTVFGMASVMLLGMLVKYSTQQQLVTDSAAMLRMFRPLQLFALVGIFWTSGFRKQLLWTLPILIATFLSGSATLGLLGVNNWDGQVTNHFGSATIELLNRTIDLFYKDEYGVQYNNSEISDPAMFDRPIIKAATFLALDKRAKDGQQQGGMGDLFWEGTPIGNSTYVDLDTGGIGVNVKSYLRYTGSSNFYHPPTNYLFRKLTGTVWAINTTATCSPTDLFNFTKTPLPSTDADLGTSTIFHITGPDSSAFTFASDKMYHCSSTTPHPLFIYSNLTAFHSDDTLC